MSTWISVTFRGSADDVGKIVHFFNEDKLPERVKRQSNWIDDAEYNFSFYSLLDITDEMIDQAVDKLKARVPAERVNTWADAFLEGTAIYELSQEISDNLTDIDDLDVYYKPLDNGQVTLQYAGYAQEEDSDPTVMFQDMCEKLPKGADIDFHWENDYHCGAEGVRSEDNNYWSTNSWDAPDSHQEFDSRGYIDDCRCNWDDMDNWYDDCPRPDPEYVYKYTVKVVTEYVVLAETDDDAKKAVVALESGYDSPRHTKVLSKFYNNEYLLEVDDTYEEEWND